MASVLRQRDFRLPWSAQTVSELGSAVTLAILTALAVLVPVRLRLSAVGRVRRLADLAASTS
jgi:hypothetical protein